MTLTSSIQNLDVVSKRRLTTRWVHTHDHGLLSDKIQANKYFYSKEEPVLSKYTPSLIKDEIKFLYEVSQDEEAMKIINQNNLKHI